MSAPIAPLDWDSAFFGIPIAQLTATRLDEAGLERALRACRQQRIRCAYLLLDADDARGSALAQTAGFAVRDVRLTFERALAAGDATAPVAESIAPARPAQRAALEALAREAFAHTRFLADERFDRARSRELYAAFVRRGLDGGPARVTLTDADARGFVVCRLDRARGDGAIELIAVAADGRSRGLGGALVAAALATFARAGLRRATVATQAANVASQRLYQHAGYRTCHAGLWLHRWFG